jgi:drug/metabolite transporter (DMT)-like permease
MTDMAAKARLRGMAYALAGFSMLSVGDAVVKTMAGQWPGTGIAALRYSFAALGLAAILWRLEGRAGFALQKPAAQIGRAVAVGLSTVCFFLAVALMPLSDATTITFTQPMFVALLSGLFLRERTPPILWLAIAIAFAGVLIVLRPNLAEVGAPGLLPVAAALCMATVIMLNRQVAGGGSILAMQFLISALATPVLILVAVLGHASGWSLLEIGMPAPSVIARCALVAVTATIAHMLIYRATTEATASEIAPMTYVQLIVAMSLGFALFGDTPDLVALGGAALVISGGLLLWNYQRNRARGSGPVQAAGSNGAGTTE